MGLKDLTNPHAVVDAVREYDSLGREAFLERYGFRKAAKYFLLLDGKSYDSKAIVGAAHAYQHPALGPLSADAFSGGDLTVRRCLERLGFTVTQGSVDPTQDSGGLVLVENERTAGGRFDDWKDVTGERYHFPNQYRNKVKTGRRFVYYRGVRRLDGKRGQPEYFGLGTIGEVYRDPDDPESTSRARRRWFCDIEDYQPFPSAVTAKQGSRFIEDIPKNFWGVGVRSISASTLGQIRRLSGLPGTVSPSSDLGLEALEPVNPKNIRLADESLLVAPNSSKSTGRLGGSPRRSRYSKAVGDRAEEVVLAHLSAKLAPDGGSVRWVAKEGETPGWDLEYRDATGGLVAIEVKGTVGSRFPSIELTAGEWAAAKQLGSAYWLYLVAHALKNNPIVFAIQNPASAVNSGDFTIAPAVWRLARAAVGPASSGNA